MSDRQTDTQTDRQTDTHRHTHIKKDKKADTSIRWRHCRDDLRFSIRNTILLQNEEAYLLFNTDGTCDSICDIGFLLDASGSIVKEDYIKQKTFVTSVARHLGISRHGPHYGVILFDYYARLNITFDQFYDQKSFERGVMNLKHPGSVTRIDKALKLAYDKLFTAKGKDNILL